MFRRRSTSSIARGERFRPIEVPNAEWQVEDVETDPLGNPHARLFLVGDPLTRRTIACARLLDPRCWIKVAASNGAL
ncbi:MAG: hypothetical protein IRZ04_21095 [Rhodospirillales bacterium]|nr:hypothetical protein [Rhodospirillales bacterium]